MTMGQWTVDLVGAAAAWPTLWLVTSLKVSALIAVAAGVGAALQPSSAARRSLGWTLALSGALILPILSAGQDRIGRSCLRCPRSRVRWIGSSPPISRRRRRA